jgi:AcrR family transcriptional regulator
MPTAATRRFEPRRQPQQERSRRMRARILQAAVRVLREDGALGFTTTRVADEAGISVGSLYQYFPNKHALVLAIHHDAVLEGWKHVEAILDGQDASPRQKIIDIAKWFFAIESSEAAQLGAVFEDVEVFLRDSTNNKTLDQDARSRFTRFLAETTQPNPAREVDLDAQLLMTTLEAVGKAVAAQPLNPTQRERWAVVTATMLSDHLGIK